MRKILRNMAKARMGNYKVGRRMSRGRWREIVGAYPTNVVTGETMSKSFRGRKKYKSGHWQHLFAY